MIPLYRPGASALHRMPAGAKLAVVFAVGVGVTLLRTSPWAAGIAWVLVLAGFALAQHPGRGRLLRTTTALGERVWGLRWLAVLIAVPQLIFLPPEEAALTTARILAVVLLAGLFTLTTRVSDVMDLLLAGFRPLERAGLGRLGLTADRLALACSLTMRSVPVVFGFYAEIAEARRARGAGRGSVVGMTTPLLVMSLKHAEETAEALAARGVR